MEKNDIKNKVRENLLHRLKETEPKQSAPAEKKPGNEHGKDYEKNYANIQDKLSGTLLKASQVFSSAGLGDPKDATARSLNSKKLRREPNDDGSVYQFNDEELAAIIKVISNPTSYLTTKK